MLERGGWGFKWFMFFICRELPRGVSHIFNGRVGEEWCKIVAGLRINHGCFPSHLCGMGLTDSPLCSLYGRVADLDHMFFGFCGGDLWDGLVKAGIRFPTCVGVLLATGSRSVCDLFVDCISMNSIGI